MLQHFRQRINGRIAGWNPFITFDPLSCDVNLGKRLEHWNGMSRVQTVSALCTQ